MDSPIVLDSLNKVASTYVRNGCIYDYCNDYTIKRYEESTSKFIEEVGAEFETHNQFLNCIDGFVDSGFVSIKDYKQSLELRDNNRPAFIFRSKLSE